MTDKIPQVGDGFKDIKLRKPTFTEEDEEKFKKVLTKLRIQGSQEDINRQLRQLVILPT